MSKMLSKQELVVIQEFKARLLDRHASNVVALKLFGSKARGDAHPESDVDLLIIVKERTAEFDDDTIDIVCDMIDEYGVYFETVTMTEDSFQEAQDIQIPFAINILREAKTI